MLKNIKKIIKKILLVPVIVIIMCLMTVLMVFSVLFGSDESILDTSEILDAFGEYVGNMETRVKQKIKDKQKNS